MDANGFEFFLFRVFFYLKIMFYCTVHGTKCFIIFRLFTDAACESQETSFTDILQPLVHHKQLPFSRLQIPLADFMRPLIIANSSSGLREPACSLQAAKRQLLVMHKQLTGSRGSRSQAALVNILQIMQCLARCTLNFYLQNIKITTR